MAQVGFNKLQSQLEAKGNSPKKAAAIAAAIGRKKYGSKKFSAMGAEARRRAGR